MPELEDLLSSEAERLQPTRVPPFDSIVRRRDRHRRVLVSVSVLGIAAVLGGGALVIPTLLADDVSGLQPSGPGTGATPAPRVLHVDCTPTGTVLPNGPRVAAQADGVHYAFRNTTDGRVHIGYALGGDAVDARSTKDVITAGVAPGQASTVACTEDIETLQAHRMAVDVEDPQHLYVPLPQCSGGTATRDFVGPMKGDPVELTLRDYPKADVVGYPQGSPRQIFTGRLLIGWEGGGDSWSPSQVTECTDPTPHVVSIGIKAPPPAMLARTDEFGLVKALRRTGNRIEVDVDRVDMLGGAEGEAAAVAAGQDYSNDYFLRNDNDLVRTYGVSSDAAVWGSITMLPGEEPWPKPTTVSVWSTFVTTPGAASTLFHFEIKDGVVVGIEEQYRP